MSVAEQKQAEQPPPLVVDLDGTLIRSDVFAESILRFAFANPLQAPLILVWLLRGRAYAKAKLAERAACDPALLPYDERVLAWLREQRAAGRALALATASDMRAARAIADHLGIFDAVFASNGSENLKSRRKALRLVEAYPEGFCYAGNESADLAVWRAASQAVVVNASAGLCRRAGREFQIERQFPRLGNGLRGLLRAIRPQRWWKNLLAFAPLVAAGDWADQRAWIGAALAFLALSLTASSAYLLSDASNIDSDRRDPRKRHRPFAAGELSLILGMGAAVLLAIAGLAIAGQIGVLPLMLFFLAIGTLCSIGLKNIPFVNAVVVATLFVLRIVIGGVASGSVPSDWLLAFRSE